MRFDLLGGNYFHALSGADLSQKAGQQLICKSLFFFFLLSFFLLFSQEKKETKHECNKMTLDFVL